MDRASWIEPLSGPTTSLVERTSQGVFFSHTSYELGLVKQQIRVRAAATVQGKGAWRLSHGTSRLLSLAALFGEGVLGLSIHLSVASHWPWHGSPIPFCQQHLAPRCVTTGQASLGVDLGTQPRDADKVRTHSGWSLLYYSALYSGLPNACPACTSTYSLHLQRHAYLLGAYEVRIHAYMDPKDASVPFAWRCRDAVAADRRGLPVKSPSPLVESSCHLVKSPTSSSHLVLVGWAELIPPVGSDSFLFFPSPRKQTPSISEPLEGLKTTDAPSGTRRVAGRRGRVAGRRPGRHQSGPTYPTDTNSYGVYTIVMCKVCSLTRPNTCIHLHDATQVKSQAFPRRVRLCSRGKSGFDT